MKEVESLSLKSFPFILNLGNTFVWIFVGKKRSFKTICSEDFSLNASGMEEMDYFPLKTSSFIIKHDDFLWDFEDILVKYNRDFF